MSSREDRIADAIEWTRELIHGEMPRRPRWWEDCFHREVCSSENECEKRHESCACVEVHETETECNQWRKENEYEESDDVA